MSYTRSQALITKDVTPEECRRYLDINTFEGQRKLNTNKSRLYSCLMAEGKMRPVDLDIAIMPNKVRYLMNGQHVCNAIIAYGKPFPARIQYWNCTTEEDAWRLFATFDVHAARTEGQVIKAARPFMGDLSEVPLSILTCAASALFMVSTTPPSFNCCKLAKTDKADMLHPNRDAVHFIAALYLQAGKENRNVFRVPAVAAMIETWRIDKTAAEKFWHGVTTGEMLIASSPQMKIRNFLKVGSGEGGGTSRVKHIYSNCVCYWNAWRTGSQRRSVKFGAMSEMPKPI